MRYETNITAHPSEIRLENMLNDYWEKYGNLDRTNTLVWPYTFESVYWYFPPCPAVDAEA